MVFSLSVTFAALCKTHPARLTSRTEAVVEATEIGMPVAGTQEKVVSVPDITDEKGARIAENREIEDLEKLDFDDVEGIDSDS